MWQTGYSGEVIKDKIKKGLDKELRREWAKAHPKPDDVAGYIEHLQELGHAIENDYLYEKLITKGKSSERASGVQENSGGKKKKKKVNEKPSSSKENADSSKKKSSTFIPFGEATKGIPKEIIDERNAANNCPKCGKPEHKFFKCPSKNPVTSHISVVTKRKRDGDDQPSESKPNKKQANSVSGVKAQKATMAISDEKTRFDRRDEEEDPSIYSE